MDHQAYIDGLQSIAEKAMSEWTEEGIKVTHIRPECIRARAGRNVADITLERAVRVTNAFRLLVRPGPMSSESRNHDVVRVTNAFRLLVRPGRPISHPCLPKCM